MDRKGILLFVIYTVFSGLLTSCGMLESGRDLRVSLPPVLPAYRSCFQFWEVEIYFEDGRKETRFYSGEKADFILGANREESLCLLCRGVLDGGFCLKPAGALAGAGTGDALNLAYEYGPGVESLVSLRLCGYDLRQFNGRRFLEETARRRTVSPWFWNQTGWFEAIAAGEFNLWDLKEGELYSVSADWSGTRWLSEDPFLGAVSDSGCLLPGGFHRFFSPRDGYRREISIGEDGAVLLIDYLASFPLD